MSIEVDTIAATSTPDGIGAIAVIRLSGPRATEVLGALVGGSANVPPPRVPTLREVRDPGDGSVLDRALVTRFEGPASYTGEDLVEISAHGGRVVPMLILEACLGAGARRAEPGEFTRRAYLHGKLDLVQVEAVADVIEARSRALHRAAIHQLDRNLSSRVAKLREEIVRVEALLAHHVDFPEEDDAPVELGQVQEQARALLDSMRALLVTAPEGQLLREGAIVVLAGAPNAGKSSLYNALIGEDRALVTPEAGTTRDALEAQVQMGGFPFRLVDTAGMREEATGVERLGIEVAERYLERAHAIIACLPMGASDGLSGRLDWEALAGRSAGALMFAVRTKCDLSSDGEYGAARREDAGSDAGVRVGVRDRPWVAEMEVSAVTGHGLDELRSVLAEMVYGELSGVPGDAPVLTRERQARAMRAAAQEVEAFVEALSEGLPAEIAATHLRSAETALEELLGVVSVDDVLDVVFRDFCIGK